MESGQKDGNKGISDKDIISNAVLFVLAGYDGIHSLLMFAAYCLALNNQIQDQLRAEIEENGGILGFEEVDKLGYLDMVVNGLAFL